MAESMGWNSGTSGILAIGQKAIRKGEDYEKPRFECSRGGVHLVSIGFNRQGSAVCQFEPELQPNFGRPRSVDDRAGHCHKLLGHVGGTANPAEADRPGWHIR